MVSTCDVLFIFFLQGGQVDCTHTCPTCNDTGTIYLHGETWKAATNSCLDCRCEVRCELKRFSTSAMIGLKTMKYCVKKRRKQQIGRRATLFVTIIFLLFHEDLEFSM